LHDEKYGLILLPNNGESFLMQPEFHNTQQIANTKRSNMEFSEAASNTKRIHILDMTQLVK
jgi:hypothetical protein